MIRGFLISGLLAGGVASMGAVAPTSFLTPAGNRLVQEDNVPYNGQFIMARIRFEDGSGSMRGFGRGFRGFDPPWHHDYPRGERNLLQILDGTTFIDGYLASSNIFWPEDPELMKFPIAYFSEPGEWILREEDVTGLRNYLLKGGFLIFDDFRGPWHWQNFVGNLREVLPGIEPIRLDGTHPIYDSFFHIPDLLYLSAFRGAIPEYWGIFRDNDPEGDLLAIANYNNDIGEYWEWADVGRYALSESNEAYKLGVNYIVYAMTH